MSAPISQPPLPADEPTPGRPEDAVTSAPGLAAPAGAAWWRMLLRDRLATLAVCYLVLAALAGILGPVLFGDLARKQNLYTGNQSPFHLSNGWQFFLGGDTLGRSELARLILAASTTLTVSLTALVVSFAIGSAWGMWAGFHQGWRETVSMRIADVIYSFPSLLVAIVILYIFTPSPVNLVLVLAVFRIPIYMRTARIQAIETRNFLFVDAALTFGTSKTTIIYRHVAPIVVHTLLTVAAMDLSRLVLTESALDFLGLGIQSPSVSWGLMVSQGRDQIQTAWWLTTFPGIAIVLTTVSAVLLANWLRIEADPDQRWRLMMPRKMQRAARRALKARGRS